VEKKEKVAYWLQSAEDDWVVANHLFEKADYSYSLFFGHLTIEKILKAIYVESLNENPPYTHRLIHLAEKIPLQFSEKQVELLETITDFNLEARYPDEKFPFKRRCTKSFREKHLKRIEEIKKWLTRKIQP